MKNKTIIIKHSRIASFICFTLLGLAMSIFILYIAAEDIMKYYSEHKSFIVISFISGFLFSYLLYMRNYIEINDEEIIFYKYYIFKKDQIKSIVIWNALIVQIIRVKTKDSTKTNSALYYSFDKRKLEKEIKVFLK
jgi:hypothetical protein